jgi:hypothetical protein
LDQVASKFGVIPIVHTPYGDDDSPDPLTKENSTNEGGRSSTPMHSRNVASDVRAGGVENGVVALTNVMVGDEGSGAVYCGPPLVTSKVWGIVDAHLAARGPYAGWTRRYHRDEHAWGSRFSSPVPAFAPGPYGDCLRP